jgi:hypothetical protein
MTWKLLILVVLVLSPMLQTDGKRLAKMKSKALKGEFMMFLKENCLHLCHKNI